jgi:hypothetical protein
VPPKTKLPSLASFNQETCGGPHWVANFDDAVKCLAATKASLNTAHPTPKDRLAFAMQLDAHHEESYPSKDNGSYQAMLETLEGLLAANPHTQLTVFIHAAAKGRLATVASERFNSRGDVSTPPRVSFRMADVIPTEVCVCCARPDCTRGRDLANELLPRRSQSEDGLPIYGVDTHDNPFADAANTALLLESSVDVAFARNCFYS